MIDKHIYTYIHTWMGRGERDREREVIYFKELTLRTIEAVKSQVCRVDQQARDPGKSRCCSSNPEALEAEFSLPQSREVRLGAVRAFN